MKKRYAIVRVDDTKEGAKWLDLFFEIFKKRKVVVELGDTKEQLIRKVAQALELCMNKGYRTITLEEYAKEIVEFLGVEE